MFKFFVVFAPLVISACSFHPSVSNSKTSLVLSKNQNFSPVEPHLSVSLTKALNDAELFIDGVSYKVSERYTSAKGQVCLSLNENDAKVKSEVFCQSNSGWYKVKPLTSSAK